MDKLAIIYWSGTGNTEKMAQEIFKGAQSVTQQVDIFTPADFPVDSINEYSKIAFGCPSMGDEILEEDEFEPLFSSLLGSLSGKCVALFGSYGWGDGQWMRDWQQRCNDAGINVFESEGFIINGEPESTDIDKLNTFGKEFALS